MKKILLPLFIAVTISAYAQPTGFQPFGTGSTTANTSPAANNASQNVIVQPTGMPYIDALAIDNALRRNDAATVYRVLGYYIQLDSTKELKPQLSANTFLSNPAINYPVPRVKAATAVVTPGGNITTPEGAGAGIPILSDPTMAIDALSKFIAERFQQELNLAYLNDFRASFDNTTNGKRFSWLFPNTADLLKNINPYSNTTFLSSLRQDAQQDFYDFPSNFCVFIDSEQVVKNNPQAAYFVLYANAVADLADGNKINDIIDLLGTSKYTDQLPNEDFKNALRTLALLSRAFRDNSATGSIWLNPAKLQPLAFAGNNQLRYLFLGLLYEKEKSLFDKISFGGESLEAILEKNASFVSEFCNYCVSIESHYNTLQESVTALKDDTATNAFTDIITISRSVAGLVDDGTNILQLVIDHTTLDAKIQPSLTAVQTSYLPMAEQVIDLFEAAHSKSYGLTLTIGLSLCNDFLPKKTHNDTLLRDALLNRLSTYGTFLVTLMEAQTSDDMVAALEVAAQPVQSYRVKRNSGFNVSINAYAGLLGGYEKLRGTDSVTLANQYGYHYGFTAPVGLAFSKGFGLDNARGGWSLTAFFPVIDVGAVTSFRLQDGQTQLPTLSWQNVWAPGAYLILGFRNSPMTLNFGTQYGPDLRKINADDNTIITRQAWKMINVGLTVDIPVFNVYTRRKK